MREYSIKVPNGMATTVLLADDDAKRAGLLGEDGKIAKTADPAKQPETIAAAKAELERQAAEADAQKAADAANNKQATPENK